MLEDEANLAIARGVMGDVFFLVPHGPGIGHLQAGDDSEQGRFS